MPVKGNASSRTTSAVAEGMIDIRENPTQDISALSRDTENALNELGRIFDKKKIEEQQELAAVFGEEAFRLAHNMKDDGSGRKIAVHAIIGGIMSQITGAGFASGAVGAGLNEALINAAKGKDPGTAQIVSAIIGAAAAKVAGGSAVAGASAAATGTKWNYLAEHQNPIQIGINIKEGLIGHMGIMVKVEGDTYSSADYGRYGDDVITSVGEYPSPLGFGTVITRWFYNPDEKINYMLNPDVINPSVAVAAYNSWMKRENYSQISEEHAKDIFVEASDINTLRNSQYYRNNTTDDYNLYTHNCTTTILNAILIYATPINPQTEETLKNLKTAFSPQAVQRILEYDYEKFHGQGLVQWRGYGMVP